MSVGARTPLSVILPVLNERDNLEPLQPGMAFTVEPGIYLPQRGGVRVEDNLIVTERGSECLSTLPRELTFIG